MLILIEIEFFLRIQIFNQEMRKSLDFDTESFEIIKNILMSTCNFGKDKFTHNTVRIMDAFCNGTILCPLLNRPNSVVFEFL